MSIERILDFFYMKASNRIKNRILNSGLKYNEIHPCDPKLISRIVNKKITKNNPYLIPDSVIRTFYKSVESDETISCGLLETKSLNFKNICEILWGDRKEISLYLEELFYLLWFEVVESDYGGEIDTESYLCDYIPYAKYSTYWSILFSNDNCFPALLYGIREDDVISHIDSTRQEALLFLYKKCKTEFEGIFLGFTNRINSFHKIDKVLKTDFLEKDYIPMLKRFSPGNDSLGLRVRDLIKADISCSASILNNSYTGITEYKKQIIRASSEYILSLEKIQDFYRK